MPYKDRDRQREFQREWCRRRREWYFEGARCVYCGTAKNLEVNHIIPLAIRPRPMRHRIWTYRREILEAELANCEPACRRCNRLHAEAHGVGPGAGKLDPDAVRDIRKRYRTVPTQELADAYGVGCGVIRNAATGVTYRHIDDLPVATLLPFRRPETNLDTPLAEAA